MTDAKPLFGRGVVAMQFVQLLDEHSCIPEVDGFLLVDRDKVPDIHSCFKPIYACDPLV